MAVAQIKSIGIIGLLKDFDKAAEICGKSEIFQPEEVNKFYSETDRFVPISIKNNFSAPLDKLKNIFEEISFEPEITVVDDEHIKKSELLKQSYEVIESLSDIISQRDKILDEISGCKSVIEQTSHFLGLDLEFEKISACEYIKVNFGRLPLDSYKKLVNYEDNPYVAFFPCTSDDNYCWGVYVAPIEESDEVDRIFSGLYFEHNALGEFKGLPEEYYKNQQDKLSALEKELSDSNLKIDEFKRVNQKVLNKVYTHLEQENLYCSIKLKAMRYSQSFIITGWVPGDKAEELKNQLEALESIEVTTDEGKNVLKSQPPVKLKNCFFSRPFEYYTEMYGLPNYNEIDPTTFIAITYTVLFGIMFGDVGHGIVLLLAALFMWKKRKMPIGRLLIPCAVSSTIFGAVFGSVFGFEHVLDPVYKALFGLEEKPIEVMAPATTNYIIYSAVGIGVVLLIVAMFLNIYSCIKRKSIGEAIFGINGLAGLVFYASVVTGLVCQMFLNIPVMTPVYILLLIVVPLILVFLREPLSKLVEGNKDWKPEKWGSFIVDNIFEMFEVLLSYVTNTMSFLRVGAFVLVHAGMMQVVFVLAEMIGGTGYVITAIIGNIIVLGLEALLVAIQVLRLEYYEMFSRFYIGEGRAYSPLKLKKAESTQ